jgi:hypothetical protein
MLCHVHQCRIPFWGIMMPPFLDHYAEYECIIILQTLVTVDLLTGCDNILFVQPYAWSVLPFLTISAWTKFEWIFLSVVKNVHFICALQCTLLCPPVYGLWYLYWLMKDTNLVIIVFSCNLAVNWVHLWPYRVMKIHNTCFHSRSLKINPSCLHFSLRILQN